ncbi:MAG: DAK2 domain-containing protein [Rudaea sp.]
MAEGKQTFGAADLTAALSRTAAGLDAGHEYLTELDQALGDGDLGITAGKIAVALKEYVATAPLPGDDLGKYLAAAGMAINRAASSTMGTLLATALMRAGKEIKGCTELDAQNLVTMLQAADTGIQERGKAKPGDKTIVDALHPATVAFADALAAGAGLPEAAAKMIAAAEAGRDSATPLRSRIGRASWQGERTEGQVDPGCAAAVIMLKALAGQ